jgi:hypothetical protein
MFKNLKQNIKALFSKRRYIVYKTKIFRVNGLPNLEMDGKGTVKQWRGLDLVRVTAKNKDRTYTLYVRDFSYIVVEERKQPMELKPVSTGRGY